VRSNYAVAVPSHRRADILAERTLRMLADGGVPSRCITVYLGTEGEAGDYKVALPPELYGHLAITGARGIGPQRNAIMRNYPKGTRLVMVDDDVRMVKVLSQGKLTRLADVDGFIREAFRRSFKAGAVLWGVYPLPNAGFMSHRLRLGLAFIIGTLFGTIVRELPCELVTVPVKEDYERSIKYFLNDGKVARFEDVTLGTTYAKTPGGVEGIRTVELAEESVAQLRRRYPELVHVNTRRQGPLPEILLRDTRPR
jgi:hypothetical protein